MDVRLLQCSGLMQFYDDGLIVKLDLLDPSINRYLQCVWIRVATFKEYSEPEAVGL